MPRAGQTTTGRRPRRSNRRHSFSIGDRKPPITGTPASRIARARSYIVRMTSPGRRPEQNRAVRSASRMDRLPMVKRVAAYQSALTRPCVKRQFKYGPGACRPNVGGAVTGYFLGGGAGGGAGLRAVRGFGDTPLVASSPDLFWMVEVSVPWPSITPQVIALI